MLLRRRRASSLKFDGEIGNHQEAIRLGQLAGLGVVIVDGGEFVAQVFLDDRFHVLGQVGQPLLDLIGFGPDAAADEGFVVVGQVHEPGEVLAEADGVDEGETNAARRERW